jgi:hypothetical protein
MNLTIIELYNYWLTYYMNLQTFCPYSDATEQVANYICETKPNWNFERAIKFINNLKIR